MEGCFLKEEEEEEEDEAGVFLCMYIPVEVLVSRAHTAVVR